MTTPHRSPEFLYTMLAIIGGVARYLRHYVNGGEFRWKKFLAHVFISGFSGFMFFKFLQTFGMSPETLAVSAGMGGWMGANAIDFIEEYIRKRFKKHG